MVEANGEIKKAIELAEQERDRLVEELQEYEAKRIRIAQLETFISTGKALFNIDASTSTLHQLSMPEISSGGATIEKPLEIAVTEILTESNRALKISEIENEFRKRNLRLSAKNGKQVLRSLLLRKHDLFKKEIVGQILYFSLQRG
ncbi:MAG: hypothetical protein ACXWMH_11220 [Syntrophales bacterium]